eukprot:CAMPEP_0116868786 /NCGR_PEP_ID=MMETSP0418-20121206/27394_1 /TAXON_ID=1158023 /ORGANISM="Astrosyne radiata, Strain 13vi08-1A" /LENGTH=756 /DNA_ID=CAMNT_0004504803 /DNA_START=184 /DNA_END=2453 /DNA_ORIENTATION=+
MMLLVNQFKSALQLDITNEDYVVIDADEVALDALHLDPDVLDAELDVRRSLQVMPSTPDQESLNAQLNELMKQHKLDLTSNDATKQQDKNLVKSERGYDMWSNIEPVWINGTAEEIIDIDDDEELQQKHDYRRLQSCNLYNAQCNDLLWGVKEVQAEAVWATTKGDGVTVCVVDTGLDRDHPDIDGPGATGYTDTDVSVTINYPWYEDDNGHGTHCAGTVAAVDNEVGVVGVAPSSKLHIIRVFGGGSSGANYVWASNIVDAAELCAEAGAKVVSMSLGGSGRSTVEENAFANLYNSGVLTIAAAGNDGNSAFSYPASYSTVVSVAAAAQANDGTLFRASFSQFNSAVDIAAPGVNILSTYKDGRYAYLQGTSMATPHVSGVAALLVSAFPDLSSNEIVTAMYETATKGLESVQEFGNGFIRAKDALDYLIAKHGDPTSDASVSVVPSSTPSKAPSNSVVPSVAPSKSPTEGAPSVSLVPSDVPSTVPSDAPSKAPSASPSTVPSGSPSKTPSTSIVPSLTPSSTPSKKPSSANDGGILDPPEDCDGTLVEFVVRTDNWGYETSIKLLRDGNHVMFEKDDFESNEGFTTERCLDLEAHCWTFEVIDSVGDGMHPPGYVAIYAGEEQIYMNTGDFRDNIKYKFGNCQPEYEYTHRCGSYDQVDILLETDGYGLETKLYLLNRWNQAVWRMRWFRSRRKYGIILCVPKNSCYNFMIWDTAYDGFSTGGLVAAWYNGDRKGLITDFERSELFPATDSCG